MSEDYLRKSDIFVLASRAEGMSNALLEAMSHGLSCIATNISGNTELIWRMQNSMLISAGEFVIDKNGFLVNPDDVEGLYEGNSLLGSKQKREGRCGKKGRIYIREELFHRFGSRQIYCFISAHVE